MSLRFSDGVEIDTSGRIRKLHLSDGWYITGHGLLIPVSDAEVDEMLMDLRDQYEGDGPDYEHNNR